MAEITEVERAAERVRAARTFAAVFQDDEHIKELSRALAEFRRVKGRNEDMPAGSPMVFECVDCGGSIVVPENYVTKPDRCTACGGEWSEQL